MGSTAYDGMSLVVEKLEPGTAGTSIDLTGIPKNINI